MDKEWRAKICRQYEAAKKLKDEKLARSLSFSADQRGYVIIWDGGHAILRRKKT